MNKLKKIVTSFRYYGRIKKGLTREQCNILADIYALLISPECSVRVQDTDATPVSDVLRHCGLSVRKFRHTNGEWIINVIK